MLSIPRNLWLIFLIALVFRLYSLSTLPYGFHIDEVKAGWNALSLLTTAHDDHQVFMPAYYDSFGDQRPTGIFYLIIPSLLLWGRTIFAVRFPSALIGALTVFPIFFLTRRLFPSSSKSIPLLAAFILALNPWHIAVSRATSEVAISLFFTAIALCFTLAQINSKRKHFIFFSVFFFFISFFFYHSIRVLAPFLVFIILYFYRNRSLVVTFILVALLSTIVMLNPASRGRLSQVSLVSDFKVIYETQKMPAEEGPGHVFEARFFHNKIAAYAKRFLEEYSNYFSPQYLVGTSARPIRYQTPYFGLITYLELFFLFVAISQYRHLPSHKILWLLLFLAPLPSAVTIEDTPNLHRSMLMVLPLLILASLGLSHVFTWSKFTKYIVVFLYLLNFSYFLHLYFVHGKFGLSTYYRDGGMIEMIAAVKKVSSNYDQIIFTNYTDNPYPWLAFFSTLSPSTFNKHYLSNSENVYSFQKYTFSNSHCPTQNYSPSLNSKKILFINGEGCVVDPKNPATPLIHKFTITRPDLSPAFQLWENQ